MKTTTLLTFILLLYAAAVSGQCTVSTIINATVSCNGGTDGSATALASNGTAPYNYIWDTAPAQADATATGLAAGVYCVTITDNIGCTATDCVTITEPSAITATINNIDIACFGGNTGSANCFATGATGGFTYLWDANTLGQTTATATGLVAGVSYCVTVTDANACTASYCTTLSQPATPLTANAVVGSNYNGTDVTCFGATDAFVIAIPAGGTFSYTFLWSVGGVTNDTLFNVGAGTYTVTTTDANGCSTTNSVVVTNPPLLSANINPASVTNVNCFGDATGSATVSASGGTSFAGYFYLWNTIPVQTTATATGLSAGSYCVTVEDNNGCSISTCVNITQPATPLIANITASTSSCGGAYGTTTCLATGGIPAIAPNYTYDWSNGQTTATATGLSAGNYCVVVTDSVGCAASTCVTITEMTINTSGSTNVTCNGNSNGSVAALASGGVAPYVYVWDTILTLGATILPAGDYCVTATDNNGCEAMSCVTITQPSEITATITSSTNISCFGSSDGSITATASGGAGGYTYLWYRNGVPIAPSVTTPTITGLVMATYYVVVTDLNGCMTTSSSVIITQPSTALTANANITSLYNGQHVSCFGANDGEATAFSIGGSGGVTYLWINGQTTSTATGLAAGTYCVTITDGNFCQDSACVTLTEPMQVSASIFSSSNPSCNGNFDGTAMAVGSGGIGSYSYQWNGATGLQTTSTATGLGANISYCVTITDANGCEDNVCVTLTQPSAVSITTSSTTHVSCFGGSNGSIFVNAVGGVPPYVYSFNGGSATTTNIFTGLAAGTYFIQVIDANGCSSLINPTITQPSALTISFSAPDTICFGTTTAITVMSTGGIQPYTYLWYDASTTNTITGISAGNHCITVIDANVCIATACKQINTINFETTIQDNWAGENPHIFMGDFYNIQTTSSHPVVSYNWTPAAGLSCTTCPNPTAAPAVTTTYYLTTLNTLGCVDEDSITIEIFTPNTSHIYIDIAPDSTVQYNYTPSALWTNGSMFNMAILLPPTLNYGVATLDTNIHQVQYMSNGTAPEVTDTVMYLICNQICDTMYFYITTASCVWAGDTDDDGIANNMDLLPIGLHHSATGITRYNASTNYICQPSRNWNVGTLGNPTVDIKHIDCDGNGVINDIDTNAIVLNWAQTHVKSLSTNISGIEIYIDTLTATPGDDISLPIILGDVANPSSGYGIAFTIHYDVMGVDTNSVSIDFNNSWLGTIGSNMIGIHKDFYSAGQVEVAMTRTDHSSVLGGGTIGYIDLTIKDDVLPKSAFVRLDFEITDVRFIDHLGDTIPTLPLPSQILIVDNWLNSSTIENSNKINVFPNPTGSLLNIQSLNENIEMLQVLDMTGKMLMQELNISDLQTVLDLNILPSGMYILSVHTATERQSVRVVKH